MALLQAPPEQKVSFQRAPRRAWTPSSCDSGNEPTLGPVLARKQGLKKNSEEQSMLSWVQMEQRLWYLLFPSLS